MAVAFKQIILPRHHTKVPTGQSVTFFAQMIDTDIVDTLLTLPRLPMISLFDSNGDAIVTDADMAYSGTPGHYRYTHFIPYNAPLGPYTGSFRALNDEDPIGDEAHVERAVLWTVIAQSTPFEWLTEPNDLGGGGGGGPGDPGGLISPLIDDLIAFWKLEEATGIRFDAHTNDLDLTPISDSTFNVVTGVSGVIGNGARFLSGPSEYLMRSAADSLLLSFGDTDFTITFWVYLLNDLSTYILFSKGSPFPSLNTMEYQIAFDFTAGRWQFAVGNGTTYAAVAHTSAAVSGVWVFLACRHNAVANTITLTVNDPAVAPAVAAWTGGSYQSGSDFALGRYGGYDGGHATAILDAVGVWGRVLTDQEITELWSGTPLRIREYPFT